MKKIINSIIAVIVITVTYMISNQVSLADKPRGLVGAPNPPRAPVQQIFMQGNNINVPFRSDGIFVYDFITFPSADAGMIWPVTAPQRQTCNFTAGIFVGGYVMFPAGRELRLGASMYNSHYSPGIIPVAGEVPPQSVCADAKYRVYYVQLTDPTLVEGGTKVKLAGGRNYTFVFDAWSAWPIDLGAPYVEVNGIPGYQPSYDGDRPGIGRSQARPDELSFLLFHDYTNCSNNIHASELSLPGGSRPIGVEIHQLAFMFNSPGLTDMFFVKWQIINKSGFSWDSTYIGVADDIDIGIGVPGSRDDAVGCDTANNVGFIYNADNLDVTYGAAPPATGIRYLQGPIIPSFGDTAFLPYDTLVNYRQLGLTGFNYFINSPSDPCLEDPNFYVEAYNIMKGLDGCGRIKRNPFTQQQTLFTYDGDACNRTGANNWFDSLSRDVRFLQNSGPFVMNNMDTQIVTIGCFVKRSSNNFQSVCALLGDAAKVKRVYDLNFRSIPLPPPPSVTAVADGNGKIALYWGNISEFYNAPDVINLRGLWKFQGYEVYQIKPGTGGESPSERSLLAIYDVIDSTQTVWDSIEVLEPNGTTQIEFVPVALGTNSGLSRHMVLSQNRFPTGVNNFFINGQDYFFSVVAYGYNDSALFINNSPKILKNAISSQIIKVTPSYPIMGSTFQFKNLDTLVTNRLDRGFLPVIMDQKKIISATYRMEFLTDTTWQVLRIRNSQVDTIVRRCLDLSLGTDSYIADGILFKGQRIILRGVIRDADPDSAEVQTSRNGWTYTSASGQINLAGVDTARSAFNAFPVTFAQNVIPMQSMSMGLSWPSGATFRSGFTSKIDSASATGGFLKTYCLKRVKITFGQTSKAYRYVGNLGLTAQFSPYRDMRDIPFKVEVDSPLDTGGAPRQINVGWLDRDSSSTWNPSDSANGGAEIVFIFYSNYSETPTASYMQDIGVASRFKQMDIMYVWWPRKINSGPAFQNGDVLTIYPYPYTRKFINPGTVLTYDVSTVAPDIGNITVAKDRNELNLIRVVPNPYFGGHSQETSPFDRFVKFTRLPKTCYIYIYTLNGNLIRTLNKDDNATTMHWDLLNTDQIPVASGIYIAYIDAPGIGTKIIKIAVFTPEERIDRF